MLYWLCINLLGFVMMCIDKQKALQNKWRIAERCLFCIAIAGGSLGIWLGMYAFRHKTRHKVFVIGIPGIFFVQIGLWLLIFCM